MHYDCINKETLIARNLQSHSAIKKIWFLCYHIAKMRSRFLPIHHFSQYINLDCWTRERFSSLHDINHDLDISSRCCVDLPVSFFFIPTSSRCLPFDLLTMLFSISLAILSLFFQSTNKSRSGLCCVLSRCCFSWSIVDAICLLCFFLVRFAAPPPSFRPSNPWITNHSRF